MKKILLFMVLFSAKQDAFAQFSPLSATPSFEVLTNSMKFSSRGIEYCKTKVDTTDWAVQGDTLLCTHDWAYAVFGDLNKFSTSSYLVFKECDWDNVEYQAHICRKCLQHEKREIRTIHYIDDKESEYLQLLEIKKKLDSLPSVGIRKF